MPGFIFALEDNKFIQAAYVNFLLLFLEELEKPLKIKITNVSYCHHYFNT